MGRHKGKWLNCGDNHSAGRQSDGSSVLKRVLGAATAAVLLALIVAATAFAAEVSRDEYKDAAEPICESNVKANERILGGVRKEVKTGKPANLKSAGAKFAKASVGQAQALRELEALARPVADEARLTKWFSYLKIEAELFATAGRKLKAGDKPGAEHITTKLTQNANKANVQVLPFEFHFCRLEPSKFT
jgi:hypothetical protein